MHLAIRMSSWPRTDIYWVHICAEKRLKKAADQEKSELEQQLRLKESELIDLRALLERQARVRSDGSW